MSDAIVPAGPLYPARLQNGTRAWEPAKQLVFVVFKWKRLVFCLFLAFAIAAAIGMYMKPPVRSATAKILLKPDRATLQISGQNSLSSKLPYSPQYMQSEVELIKSREVLVPVAKRLLSKQREPGREVTTGEISAMVEALARHVVPTAFPENSTVQVTFFGETAEEATQTLDIMMEHYMQLHELIYTGSTRMLKFYEDERDRVGADLQAAEDRLKQWQETGNIVSVDEQISRQLMTQGDRERALQQVEADLAMSRDNVRDPVVAKLKGDLVTSEVGLQDLLQRYTDNDRHVQERREQIGLIKRQLASAERAFLTSLTSQRDILRKQIQEAAASLATLRERKFEGTRLSQAVDLARESYQLYGKKLEEARIASRLDREQLSNVAVIEQPHPTLMTDLNKRIGGVFLAAIAGIALGVAIAFGFEFFNNSLRTEDDVENYLGLPVLAAIPELHDRTLALKS